MSRQTYTLHRLQHCSTSQVAYTLHWRKDAACRVLAEGVVRDPPLFHDLPGRVHPPLAQGRGAGRVPAHFSSRLLREDRRRSVGGSSGPLRLGLPHLGRALHFVVSRARPQPPSQVRARHRVQLDYAGPFWLGGSPAGRDLRPSANRGEKEDSEMAPLPGYFGIPLISFRFCQRWGVSIGGVLAVFWADKRADKNFSRIVFKTSYTSFAHQYTDQIHACVLTRCTAAM